MNKPIWPDYKTYDWSKHNKYSEDTCHCCCGTIYRSHSKIFMTEKGLKPVSRKVCPNCNRNNNHWKVSGDPETYIIDGKQ